MKFDELDLKILHENFDEDTISQIDTNNVSKIFGYLNENGVYYAKDLFLNSLDLFILNYEEFIRRFEKMKEKIGIDFVDKLGEDSSLIEYMYIDY